MEAWDSTGAVYSGSYSLRDDVAAAQSDYETRHGAHGHRAGSRRAPMVPALEVFDLSAVCPLRHKGLLYWGAYGSSVGLTRHSEKCSDTGRTRPSAEAAGFLLRNAGRGNRMSVMPPSPTCARRIAPPRRATPTAGLTHASSDSARRARPTKGTEIAHLARPVCTLFVTRLLHFTTKSAVR